MCNYETGATSISSSESAASCYELLELHISDNAQATIQRVILSSDLNFGVGHFSCEEYWC